jgi:hypothetical protein
MELPLGRSFIVIKPVYAPRYWFTGNGYSMMDNRDNQQFRVLPYQ